MKRPSLPKQFPREYKSWCHMRDRCNNPFNPAYWDYGGRGITICSQWNDFAVFLRDVGRRPSPQHSIDRFPNKDGNYEPSNVRWATMKEQALNRRSNRIFSFNGETKTLSEWAKQYNRSAIGIHKRLQLGWTFEDALTLPKYSQKRK